ncbi:Flavoprotein [Ancylostoma duodenale]|uniref:Flavoprotein n=1 Tax=Ancylostoma duodenale TaxID=51022 RepID=A0A0C2GUD9_9BILA|nr:Flavoprotein [Ancylostoma duodenale]
MSSEANPASEEGSQSNGGVTEPNAKRIRQEEEGQSDDEEQCSSAKNVGRRPPFTRSHKIQRSGGKFHLLIGVSGSVAVIKLEELIQKLYQSCPENKLIIKVAATKAALNLLETQDFEIDEVIYEDRDEWSMWRELRKWADAMLIAPLDANTLAKIAVGINDNLVTSIMRVCVSGSTGIAAINKAGAHAKHWIANNVDGQSNFHYARPQGAICHHLDYIRSYELKSFETYIFIYGEQQHNTFLYVVPVRAWDPRKPLYFAPAMNTMMWENPLTFQHRNTLKDLLRYKVSTLHFFTFFYIFLYLLSIFPPYALRNEDP